MTLHKEGTGTISLTIIGLLAANAVLRYFLPEQDILQTFILIVSLFLFVIVVQFFRKPIRTTPVNPKHIIAPADGKVVVIEEVVETEYFKEPRRQVSIFMSPLNVHINFNPISGIVTYLKYHAGKYLVAWHPKSSTDNERSTCVVKHQNGQEILFRQIAGAMARRICYYAQKGDNATQGAEFGFIKFGSRVDLFLPLGTKIDVVLNQKVKAKLTKLGSLN
jgi:phosphatidylserine decarboxylase